MGHMMGKAVSASQYLASSCLSLSHIPLCCIFLINIRLLVCHTKRTFSWPEDQAHVTKYTFFSSF